MTNEWKNLPNWIIIALSSAWCAYTSAAFLQAGLITNLYLSVTVSVAVSLGAHFYIHRGVALAKAKRVSPYQLIALLLSAAIVLADFNGVGVLQHNTIVAPVIAEKKGEIDFIQEQIRIQTNVLNENADWDKYKGTERWTKKGKHDSATAQLEQLNTKLSVAKGEKTEEVATAKEQAAIQEFAGKGLSVLALVVSLLLTWAMGKPEVKSEEEADTKTDGAITTLQESVEALAGKMTALAASKSDGAVTAPTAKSDHDTIGFVQPSKLPGDGELPSVVATTPAPEDYGDTGYPVTCVECGTHTRRDSKQAKYCGDECKRKAEKRREKEKKQQGK